jgi:hypothetical protein
MATRPVCLLENSSYAAYVRVYGLTGAQLGQVLDFADNTFKPLGSATTPYQTATAVASGTGKSLYVANLDLDELNPDAVDRAYRIQWYNNASPAAGDVPLAVEAPLRVIAGRAEPVRVEVQVELAVKSTAGLAAQLSVWLEIDGQRIPVDDLDATATCSVLVREHGAGAPLFTATGDVSDVTNHVFEIEQASPGFTDDRIFEVTASITVNGTTWSSTHARAVIG